MRRKDMITGITVNYTESKGATSVPAVILDTATLWRRVKSLRNPARFSRSEAARFTAHSDWMGSAITGILVLTGSRHARRIKGEELSQLITTALAELPEELTAASVDAFSASLPKELTLSVVNPSTLSAV